MIWWQNNPQAIECLQFNNEIPGSIFNSQLSYLFFNSTSSILILWRGFYSWVSISEAEHCLHGLRLWSHAFCFAYILRQSVIKIAMRKRACEHLLLRPILNFTVEPSVTLAEPVPNCLPAEPMLQQHLPTLQAHFEAEERWTCSCSWESGWGREKRAKRQTWTGIPKHMRLFGQHAWQWASLRSHSTLCCRCNFAHWQVLGNHMLFLSKAGPKIPSALGRVWGNLHLHLCQADRLFSQTTPRSILGASCVPACVSQGCANTQWFYHTKQQLALLTSWLHIFCSTACLPAREAQRKRFQPLLYLLLPELAPRQECAHSFMAWQATLGAAHTNMLSSSHGSAKTGPGAACPTQHGQGPWLVPR